MKYSPDWPLEISASLKPANHVQGVSTWLIDMCETSALISAILRVIHPKLYISGRDTLRSMRGLDHLHPILGIWSSVFNVVTVLSNHIMPLHRDNYSRPQWYDILTTIGPYTDANMELPRVGLSLKYSSGTVIGFSGKLLRHGVPHVNRERICLAYYMRDKVQERMEMEVAPWMKMEYYG